MNDLTIAFVSDLHLECHADGGLTLVGEIDDSDVDVLVLAGDIAVGESLGPALEMFASRFTHADVVFVCGNHEYYGATREVVRRAIGTARERHSNLHVLDGEVIALHGHRFVGGTLWFRDTDESREHRQWLTDFRAIPDFQSWVFDENARHLDLLERELCEGDVVITHHLPAEACVSPRFQGSPTNAFFVCDVEPLIRGRKPALWIHGHTHDSVDVTVGETRVVCNPFGYARHQLNPEFDASRRVRVGTRVDCKVLGFMDALRSTEEELVSTVDETLAVVRRARVSKRPTQL